MSGRKNKAKFIELICVGCNQPFYIKDWLNLRSRRYCNRSCFKTNHLRNGKHWLPEFDVYFGIRARCQNPTSKGFQRYGGRGITIDPRWDTFARFYKDMGPRPSANHSIDRIDNNGPYSPENCRWATQKQQSRNTRINHNLTCKGRTQCVAAWAEELGVSQSQIRNRLSRGWDAERALTTPTITPDQPRPNRKKDAHKSMA